MVWPVLASVEGLREAPTEEPAPSLQPPAPLGTLRTALATEDEHRVISGGCPFVSYSPCDGAAPTEPSADGAAPTRGAAERAGNGHLDVPLQD